MNIEVIKHEKETVGLLHHKALIKVDDWNGNEEELVEQTSIKCNYHPAGYGIYGGYSVKQLENKKVFVVSWRTGNHCN